jgi:hypothetical protein
MLSRRSDFLEKAGRSVPAAVHEWMKYQPFLPSDGKKASLFGNVMGKVQDYKLKEDKAAANEAVAQLKFPLVSHRREDRRGFNGGNRGSHRDRTPSATYTPSAQGRSYGRQNNSRAHGFKKPGFAPSRGSASRGGTR